MASKDCWGRFVWHDLMTTDVDAALAFYTGLFPEWTVTAMKMEGGFTYRMINSGGLDSGGIVPLESGGEIPSHWISYIAVEDCDAAVQAIEDRGGTCCIPAVDMPDVGRFAVMKDPQGALIKPFQLAFPVDLPEHPAVGQFCWDELATSDREAAKTLYAEVFGWEASDVDMDEQGVYTLFKLGDMDFAGAMDLPPDSKAPPHWTPYLSVDDADARAAMVEELGGKIYVPPKDIPNIGRFSVQADPNGAVFSMIASSKK
ncbi:MAG: VOC family protein [Planctomycetales bacterium]